MTLGHIKGRKGERDVAKICQKWWMKVDKKCLFKRRGSAVEALP